MYTSCCQDFLQAKILSYQGRVERNAFHRLMHLFTCKTSGHMAHLHLWGMFCLKSSQSFRLYDKSRPRLSQAERLETFASLPPDNSFIRLNRRFAAWLAQTLTSASQFLYCLCTASYCCLNHMVPFSELLGEEIPFWLFLIKLSY